VLVHQGKASNKMKLHARSLPLCAALVLSSFFVSCTPEKARALRIAAVQFRVEAMKAIDLVEQLLTKETSPRPRGESEAAEEFARNILQLKSDTDLSEDKVDLAVDPYTVQPGSQQKAREEFVTNLRRQYSAFAATFDELEGGSYLARDAVRKSGSHAQNLTLQMAAFAESISQDPPQFLQYRSALMDEIDSVRKNASLSSEDKTRRLIKLKEEWEAMKQSERELQRSTVEQCLKATVIGREVGRLIDTYEHLSVDDLNVLTARALDAAGELTGKDLQGLTVRSADVFLRIREDPVWSNVADSALTTVNQELRRKGPDTGGNPQE